MSVRVTKFGPQMAICVSIHLLSVAETRTKRTPSENCFSAEASRANTADHRTRKRESMSKRPVKFSTLLGGDFYLARHDLHRYFSEPLVMVFFALCAFITVVYRSGGHYDFIEGLVSPNLVFGLEIINALAVLTFLNGMFYTQAFLQRRGIIKTVLIPLVTLPTACFIQLSTAVTVWFLTSTWPDQLMSLTELSQDAMVIIAFEAMFAIYVVPISETFTRSPPQTEAAEQDAGGTENAPEQAVEETAVAAGATQQALPDDAVSSQEETDTLEGTTDTREDRDAAQADEDLPVFVNSIRNMTAEDFEFVRSKGHYLHFMQGSQETTVRGNLRSVHEQLGSTHGVQVNRSVWVSFHAVKEIRDEDGKCVVALHSGHEEKATAARKLAVTMAYQAYQASRDAGQNQQLA